MPSGHPERAYINNMIPLIISKSSGSSERLPKKMPKFAGSILNGWCCQQEERLTKFRKNAQFVRVLCWPASQSLQGFLIARWLTIL